MSRVSVKEDRIIYSAVTEVDDRNRTVVVGWIAKRRSSALEGKGATKNRAKINLREMESDLYGAQSNQAAGFSAATAAEGVAS
jgi:hypothetical protein